MEHTFEPVIGLEIHLQLNTASKMFCSCKNEVGAQPNTNICPLCTGQLGVLPVLNKQAVKLAIKAGLALKAKINEVSVFARKNYFYPDLPKGYQISQDLYPVISNGYIEVEDKEGNTKKIGITRAHLEEDAGKSMHGGDCSLIDLNRAGVPLLEIVSEPDMRSPQEAYNYLTNLKKMMAWLDISNCDMEKGELRVDVNLSLRPVGTEKFGTRIEIKNLNSFKAVKDALTYEIERQTKLLNGGGKVLQQTMLWDDAKGQTAVMRSKETAQEYRYFPEPDLPPLKITQAEIEEIKNTLPLLPNEQKKVYMDTLGLNAYDAGLVTQERATKDYFEAVLKEGVQAKAAVNWIFSDLAGKLKAANLEITQSPVKAADLAFLIKQIEGGKISSKIAKEVFIKAFDTKENIKKLLESSGASQVNDEAQLEEWAKAAIAGNPKAAAEVKAGNAKAIGALVGPVMKASKGKANPALLNKILNRLIKG